MDKPIKKPHGAPEPGGSNMQPLQSQRQRDDNYAHVLVNCRDNWRVITARTGDQWVIQKRSSSTNTGVWLGKLKDILNRSLFAQSNDRNRVIDFGARPVKQIAKTGHDFSNSDA